MSERSKGDTSSSLGTTAAAPPPSLTSGRVVKNPLLSASVTGLTFDDFQNKPLLLPAAPPIVHPTPLFSRESTPLVTVGKSADIDTDNLSEVNLNETTSASPSNIIESSDENSNSLIESTNEVDNSILSQAASSFSQLPSVASSVFSTFSKKFNSTTGRDDINSNPQLDIQPFATPFVGQASVQQSEILPPPTLFGNQQQQQQQIGLQPQNQSQAPPAEPPTFYRPSEVPPVSSGPSSSAPTSGQNTYRLSAKKKTYAQIPGLSSTSQEVSLPAAAPGITPPIGFQPSSASDYSSHSKPEKPEESKSGLFSLSNLGVPNVLQNLSGLVQSASGISQKPQDQHLSNNFESSGTGQTPASVYSPQTSQVNNTGIEQAVNFFAAPSAPLVTPNLETSSIPPPSQFSQPSKDTSTTGAHFSTTAPISQSQEEHFTQQQTFFEPSNSSSGSSTVTGYPAKNLTPDPNKSLKNFTPDQTSKPELNSEKTTSDEKTLSESSTTVLYTEQASSSELPNLNESATPKSDILESTLNPVSDLQSNLISEQVALGVAPISTENYFSEPPSNRITSEQLTKSNFNSEEIRAAESYFSGPPPKSVVSESTSIPNYNIQQSTSTNFTNLYRSPPTRNFAEPPAPVLFFDTNLNSEQAASVPPTNYLGPPPKAGSYYSGPPIKSLQATQPIVKPVGNSEINYGAPPKSDTFQGNSSLNYYTPSLYPAQQPSSIPESYPLPPLPQQVKPPSSGPPSSGFSSSSFRLLKGTRLYKSPFTSASSEYQPQVQNPQKIFTPPPPGVSYINPQPPFQPFQGQNNLRPISDQKPLLKPPPKASNYPPKKSSVLHPLSVGKASTAEPINFSNSQEFNPYPEYFGNTKTSAQLNILQPSAEISKNPAIGAENFSNRPVSSSPFSLPDQSIKFEPLNTLQPLVGADGLLPKDSLSTASADAPKIDKFPELSTTVGDVNQGRNPVPFNVAEQFSAIDQYQSTAGVQKQEKYEDKLKESKLVQEQQRAYLPPPPVVNFATPTQPKETANFPPPPPHNSFQNKPISNPYRKGLQTAHSQLPAPSSLSPFFNPTNQENNFFQSNSAGSTQAPQSQPNANYFNSQENKLIQPSEAFKAPTLPQEVYNYSQDTLNSSQNWQETPQPSAGYFDPRLCWFCVNPQEVSSFPASLTFEGPKEISPEVYNFSEETLILSQTLQPQTEFSEQTPTLPSLEPTAIASIVPEENKHLINEIPLKSEATEKSVPPQEEAENRFDLYKPDIDPNYSNDLSVASKPEDNSKIASPNKSQDNPFPEPVPNLFSGYQAATSSVAAPNPSIVQQPSLPDPTTFFDSFSLVPSVGVAAAPPIEDPNSQRIQNFFNNPPPKELDTVGDLNYNLVGSGLSVQNLQIRSLTPVSNLAEPPSSSCSEFSELNSSLSAANRQPLIQAADSTKVSPEEEAIFESPEYQDLPEEIVNEIKMANNLLGNGSPTSEAYKPAVKHWFYKKKMDVKFVWTPFSFRDSALIEAAFLKGDEGPNLVAVEGGRFDVNISERTKSPVYWEGDPIEVKRCSWFYKANDSKYAPYEEGIADLLEEEYKKAYESCDWHKKIPIFAGDTVVFHGPTVIVHFHPQQQIDSWGGSSQTISRPRVVKRDLEDFNIEEGESDKVDHLLFIVHGIGSACDLKMRSVEEVVDEFRSIALQLVQSHYKNSVENGFVGRVEVLPVSWHSELHSDEFGIDEKLKSITLESIPKLRNFTNDTLLDILFYTSPMFCQRIINTVTSSMNDIYEKYRQRNPEFKGEVSLAGHSLGSLIMFDLLCHQRPHKKSEEKNMDNAGGMTSGSPVESNQLKEGEEGKNITYKMGQAGTGQPFISYPQLHFQPRKFFALGSPIGMFVTIRGIDKLGLDFHLPTCPGFYNIFHPYDPVAYRLEALVNPDMSGIPPVLIPHHKGRKRMHLELKETMSRVGADLKQRFFETFKTTLDSVNFLTPKAKNDPKELKEEVDRLLELQQQTQQGTASTSRSRANSSSTNQSDTDMMEIDFPLGKLNDSKRVDYVLQEAPLEFFNEYLFALSSHVCYWESEDTILFVMKQIYNEIGISPDSQIPQQTMTIERPSSSGQQSPTN